MFNIALSDFLAALALVFVLEGLLPFLNPEGMRRIFSLLAQIDNQTLRFFGLTSMIIGIILLYIAR